MVEYKGEHIADGSDTAEKRAIGELWQRKSGGQGLFIVVEKVVNGKDTWLQLEAFLTANRPPRTLSGVVSGFRPPFKSGTGYAPE